MLSNRAICSAMDSFFRQLVALRRQSRQRSSEHHWHWRQSGQGCFFSRVSIASLYALIIQRDKPAPFKQATALPVQVARLAEFGGEQQEDGDGYSRKRQR